MEAAILYTDCTVLLDLNIGKSSYYKSQQIKIDDRTWLLHLPSGRPAQHDSGERHPSVQGLSFENCLKRGLIMMIIIKVMIIIRYLMRTKASWW